jgi:hypothetical protein
VTAGTSGTRVTAGVPGTGLSYTKKIGGTSSRAKKTTAADTFITIAILASVFAYSSSPQLLWVTLPVLAISAFVRYRLNSQKAYADAVQPKLKQLDKAVERIESSKMLTTRLKCCQEAIGLVSEIKTLDPEGQVLENADQLKAGLGARLKVLPVLDALEKAELKQLAGDDKSALGQIVKALELCKDKAVIDQDFATSEARDQTGNPVTIGLLEKLKKDIEAR